MSRPRIPAETLAARGAFNNRPGRAAERDGEPVPTEGIGDPPDHLPEPVRAAWVEIVSTCHVGVLSPADSIAVEVAATLLAELRADPAAFKTSRLTVLQNLLSKFGMMPADRQRVRATPPKQASRPLTGLASFRRPAP